MSRSLWIPSGVLSIAVAFTTASASQLPAKKSPPEESTVMLIKRYQQYRKHLREGPPAAQAELRAWDGPLHRVMSILGERFSSAHYPASEVVSLLGPPDKTIAAGSNHSGQEVPVDRTHLIYWWRGGHDYLYFAVRNGVVESAEWYYAGE